MKTDNENNFKSDGELETYQQYRERWKSIHIIYFTMFIISLGFSIIITSVWPYLDKLDPTTGKEFMGYVVAANPFAQMIVSPLFGWWSNRLGSIRLPITVSLGIFILSNTLYSCLELFEENRKYWMLLSRLIVGISSANVATCRSYVSEASRLAERTKAVSMISLAQVLGFIVGPAVQTAVVSLGNDGISLINNRLRLNMFTAAGWINVFLALIDICLFNPRVFEEHKIAAREALLKARKTNQQEMWSEEKINYFSASSWIVAFFVLVFNFVLLETLSTPLTMDQFAWSKKESLWYIGVIMSVGALISTITFIIIPILTRDISEIKVMIWGGFLLMVIGVISIIPFRGHLPQTYDARFKVNLKLYCQKMFNKLDSDVDLEALNNTLHIYDRWLDLNETDEVTIKNMTLNCGEDLLGCPSIQEWCFYVPQVTLAQFLIGILMTFVGYPVGITLLQSTFSKMLGSKPQGVWMGFMTGSGCLSRVLGPIFVTYVYEKYGTVWTFGITATTTALCLIWLLAFRNIFKLEHHNSPS